MSVIKFSFLATGKTRTEVLDELDSMVALVLANVTGEPWVDVEDEIEKIPINPNGLVNDPDSWAYSGKRTVLFAGPTLLADDRPKWRDGFRPQSHEDSSEFN